MKNMEDVWKDIRLNNLKERPNRSYDEMEPTESCRRMMLQEFLARPFAEHQQRLSEVSGQHTKMDMGGAFSGASHRRPATALSLNSSSGQFNYLASIGLVPNIPPRSQPLNCCSGGVSTLEPSMVPSPPTSTFEAVGSSFCKKRVPENLDTSGDRRHQRMIRNRESAARSRARKQAYTNELEQEVAHLVEENARLKEHHQKLQLLLAASAPAPIKSKLQRSSTAPF